MNKKVLVSLVSMMSVALAAVGVSRLIQYYTSFPEADPVYERVEAERYEIAFPFLTNDLQTVGGIFFGMNSCEDIYLIGTLFFDDEDCIVDELFRLSIYVYTDGVTALLPTAIFDIAQGDYGRYVISETQVVDEPIAYTLEPVYEYVLV